MLHFDVQPNYSKDNNFPSNYWINYYWISNYWTFLHTESYIKIFLHSGPSFYGPSTLLEQHFHAFYESQSFHENFLAMKFTGQLAYIKEGEKFGPINPQISLSC